MIQSDAPKTLVSLAFAVSILLSMPVFADGSDPDKDRDNGKAAAAVAQFVPASMAKDSAADPNEFPLRTAFATGQLDSSGKTYVVAAYANGLSAQVRLLGADSAGAYSVVADAVTSGMFGQGAAVDLIDVDGDGFNDVVASFSTGRGPSRQWLFKWTGTKFVDLTPLEAIGNGKTSALHSAVVLDVDGDGKPDIVNSTERPTTYADGSSNPEMAFRVYKLHNGVFEDAGTLVYHGEFSGGPSDSTESFSVNRTDITYTVTIVNGDRQGNHRVTKGSVSLNGVLFATASEFKSQPVARSVHLSQSNDVQVSIDGPRDQTLLVAVRPDVPYAAQPVVPKAKCVWLDGSGSFTASFGYQNPNPSQVLADIGTDNSFGDRANRGQPAAFLPGEHDAAFWVQSNGETLTWTLNGTTVSATAALPACTDTEPVNRTSSGGVRTH